MSYLVAAPETLSAAAGNLEGIGWALTAANAAASTQTTGLVAMAADEVSAALTAAFSSHAQHYQALSAQAAAVYSEFQKTPTIAACLCSHHLPLPGGGRG
jgi:PE family